MSNRFLLITLHDSEGETLEASTIGVGEAGNRMQVIEEAERLWVEGNKKSND